MSKAISSPQSSATTSPHATEFTAPAETSIRAPERSITESAQILGQPDGPFGTAALARHTVLLRSLGTARFSKFETLEIAPHGIFVVCQDTKQNPYQTMTTLLEIQLFLGEATAPNTPLIKAMGRIEKIKPALDLPVPTPSGYIIRLLQVGTEDARQLETYIHEHLLSAAM